MTSDPHIKFPRRGLASLLVLAVAPTLVAPAGDAGASPASLTTLASRSVVQRINAFRAAAGLSVGTESTAYTREVTRSLATNLDPPFAAPNDHVVGEYALWGQLVTGPSLVAQSAANVVNLWVRHDKWRGSSALTANRDCPRPRATGCNGHRRAVLSRPPIPGAHLVIDALAQPNTVAGTVEWRVAVLMVWTVGR